MVSYKTIRDFLAQKSIAVVGVSRSGKKFGNSVFNSLKEKGYSAYAVNPQADSINGEPCFPDLFALPEKVGGVVIVVPPLAAAAVVRDANILGIRHVWLQQGSESEEAIVYCRENGIAVVYGECILMFAEPVTSVHRLHKWIARLLGKLPRSTNGKDIPIRPLQQH